jgi:hypothetical protein
MNRESDVSDQLSSAIGEFRKELLDWIDTELVRLLERESVDSVSEEERSLCQSSSLRINLGATRGRPLPQSGIERQESHARERIIDHKDVAAETMRQPDRLRERPTDLEARKLTSDPRERLDALARLLDKRIKQAESSAETTGDTRTNTGSGDDAPSLSPQGGRR